MRRPSRLAVGVLLGALPISPLFADTLSTWKGGAGSWNTSTQWSAGIPNSTSYSVRIDGSAGVTSVVSVPAGTFAINGLTIDQSDALSVLSSGILEAQNVVNSGTITSGSGAYFGAASSVSQTSSGQFIVDGGRAYLGTLTGTGGSVVNIQNAGTLTVGSLQTAGSVVQLGVGTLATITTLSNQGGTLTASGAATVTSINNIQGSLQLGDGAKVTVGNSYTNPNTLANTSGVIALSGNASLTFNNITVTGGVLQTSGTSAIHLDGNFWFQAGALKDITVNGTVDCDYAAALGGTLTNNGDIYINPGYQTLVGTSLTLGGTGTMHFRGGHLDPESAAGSSAACTLTNRAGHTIEGWGSMGDTYMTIVNAGMLQASQDQGQLWIAAAISNQVTGRIDVAANATLDVVSASFVSTGTITIQATGVLEIEAPGASSGSLAAVQNSGTLLVTHGGIHIGQVTGGTVTSDDFGVPTIDALDVQSLNVKSGSTVIITPTAGKALPLAVGGINNHTTQLTVGGALDIGNNGITVAYGAQADPITALRTNIQTGYNNGSWIANNVSYFSAITSSTARGDKHYGIGYADSATDAIPSLPANSILIACTFVGDSNLDGTVDFSDLLRLASGYGHGATDWASGDYNYDGITNSADVRLFAMNYSLPLTPDQASQLSPAFQQQWALVQTPEPASVAFLAAAGSILFKTRRRR